MRKCVLITGGFGYIGSQIAHSLFSEKDYTIHLASRNPQRYEFFLPEAKRVELDLLRPETFPAVLDGVQLVVHLAALNENESLISPHDAMLVNSLGTYHLLQAAIDANVERFIYFSTAHIYGAPLSGHLTEKSLPKPIHPYAITHRVAEDLVLAAHDKNELIGIVIRLSNGIGACLHQNISRWTLLVNDLCSQIVHTGQMVLKSNGLQQRNFITLDDVGRAVVHLLSLSRQECVDGVFNLGGENSFSILEMAQKVGERCQHIMGTSPSLICPNAAINEEAFNANLFYDCSKIKRTGLQLTNEIDRAIDETLQAAIHYC